MRHLVARRLVALRRTDVAVAAGAVVVSLVATSVVVAPSFADTRPTTQAPRPSVTNELTDPPLGLAPARLTSGTERRGVRRSTVCGDVFRVKGIPARAVPVRWFASNY